MIKKLIIYILIFQFQISNSQSSNLNQQLKQEYNNKLPIIIKWQDIQDIPKEFQNNILISHIIIPLNSSQDITNEQNHKQLKIFNNSTINDDNIQIIKQKLKSCCQHSLVKIYSLKLTDFQNYYILLKLQSQKPIEWDKIKQKDKIYCYFTESHSVGCPHYCRGCQIYCNQCNKFYPCRFCHDDTEVHQMNRKSVEKVKCIKCNQIQKFSNKCINCGQQFGQYVCNKCKLLDSTGNEGKPIYHCDKCGYCLTGIEEYSKHCDKCNNCFNIFFFDQHECCETEDQCCICYGDLKNSTLGRVVVPVCHHQMHATCYRNLIQSGIFKCPVCKRSIMSSIDRNEIIKQQEQIMKCTVVPTMFAGRYVQVQCNDCGRKWYKQFSINYYYCYECKTYNCDIICELDYEDGQQLYYQEIKTLKSNQKVSKTNIPNQPDINGIQTAINNLIERQINEQSYINKEDQNLIEKILQKIQQIKTESLYQFILDQIIDIINENPCNFNSFIESLKGIDVFQEINQE